MKSFGIPDVPQPPSADYRPRTGWQPIATAPMDGTLVDLWIDGGRWPSCRWGKPYHTCGEAGRYCDDDWHRAPDGWIDTTFNCAIDEAPTHWMPLPESPHGA